MKGISGIRLVDVGTGLFALVVLLVANTGHGQSVPVGGGGEAGLWNLWMRHMADPSRHDQHAEAFRAFVARRPPDPLSPVAQTLHAWHLLKLGREGEARALLEPLATQNPAEGIGKGARDLARAWLTCLDRELLVAALEQYRIREVRYPERLSDLETWPHMTAKIPFLDRWGNRWDYRTESLRSMPLLQGQRYVLASRMLGDVSALKAALALKYAERNPLVPVQMRAVAGRPSMVSLLPEGAAAGVPPAMVMTGTAHEGITVAYASPGLVILHDRLHWKIAITPKR